MSEMPKYMSFRSNGVDQVRSLRKDPTQFRLANLCVNGTCSANFATNSVKNTTKHEFWVQWSGWGVLIIKNPAQLRLANFCINSASSASFASTFVQK
jgi:hypothetical protein